MTEQLSTNVLYEQKLASIASRYFSTLELTWEDLQGKDILDLGAGSAGFALAAKARGIEIISLDRYSRTAGWGDFIAGVPPKVPFIEADMYSLPFKADSFDLVITVGVMSITKKRARKLIPEVMRILRSGGEFRFAGNLEPDSESALAAYERSQGNLTTFQNLMEKNQNTFRFLKRLSPNVEMSGKPEGVIYTLRKPPKPKRNIQK